MKQQELYETISGAMLPLHPKKVNPLIRLYGPGPADRKCGECIHHYFKEVSRRYPKCEKRKITSSAATDHSSRFPTCGKFKEKDNEG